MRGDVYPDGPMRPPSAIQRGSVQFLSVQPGDPSTPGGAPSIAGAKRLTRDQMTNVTKIPSLPISYGEAEKILANDVPALYLFDLPRLNIWDAKLEGLWENEPISQVYVRDAYWAD